MCVCVWRGGYGSGGLHGKRKWLDAGCLEGAVGSTKCPSKTSERALKECVYTVSVCVCTRLCYI